jgi:hypothetical protein
MIGDGALETRSINKLLLLNNRQLDNLEDNSVDNHDQ